MRQWRFNKDSTIDIELIHLYVQESIENEKKDLKIKPPKKSLIIPPELNELLAENKLLTKSLTN